MNAEVPKTFSVEQVTSSTSWREEVVPQLFDLLKCLPGTEGKDAEVQNEWIPSWEETGSRRCDSEHSYYGVCKRSDEKLVGIVTANGLNEEHGENLINFKVLQADHPDLIPENVEPEEVLYVSNLITLPEAKGRGISLALGIRNFVRKHSTYRYVLLRTNAEENNDVINLYEGLKFKRVGSGLTEGTDGKIYFIRDLKPELDTQNEVEGVFKKTPEA